MPMVEFNNYFVFHRTWSVDIRSIVKFLQIIYDFLASGKKKIGIFLVALFRNMSSWPNLERTLFQSRWWGQRKSVSCHKNCHIFGTTGNFFEILFSTVRECHVNGTVRISESDLNYIQSESEKKIPENRENVHQSPDFGRIFPKFLGKLAFKALWPI